MLIHQKAIAGTLESSDIMITVEPGTGQLDIQLESSVYQQFGDSIRNTIQEVAQELGVEKAVIYAIDHGALDCTIRARVETALRRAAKEVAG